jgi:hypothetical protein
MVLVACLVAGAVGGAAPATAADDGCFDGQVCLYENQEGTLMLYKLLPCQDVDLGRMSPALNDRASSVRNRSDYTAHLYNWNGRDRWDEFDTIGGHTVHAFIQGVDNILDRVRVEC